MDQFGNESFSQKLDEILRLSEENNRMLRGQRRDKWLGVLLKIVVWAIVLLISYYFTMQYLTPVLHSFEQIQSVTSGLTGAKTTPSAKTETTVGSSLDIQKFIDLYNQYKTTSGQ